MRYSIVLFLLGLTSVARADQPTTRPASQPFAADLKLSRLLEDVATARAKLDALKQFRANPFDFRPQDLSLQLTPTTQPLGADAERWGSFAFRGKTVYTRPAIYHETPTVIRNARTGQHFLHRDDVGLDLIDDRPKQK